MKRNPLLLVTLAVCLLMFSACSQETQQPLNSETISYGNEILFSFTLDDFITTYNRYYNADHKQDYLRNKEQWILFNDEPSPFSEDIGKHYIFNYSQDILTYPTISVYTPLDSDCILGITVDFDDHGYSEFEYGVYEEQCFYTLKALFPELSNESLTEIYTDLNKLAYELFRTERLCPETIPDRMYYSGSVGVFSYFGQGSYVNLCIVPVTDEYIYELENAGTEIIFIAVPTRQ